ncbi:MAG: glycosyl transferase [Paenibacillaceae bacterium]|nr:glycosyl transferase [Paenibacillaceae bacterium]
MLPKINQILNIQINSIDEEEARQEYKARISDVTDDYIQMEVPMNEKNGRLKRLYAGDELSIFFLTEGGVKNYFTSTVLGFQEEVIRTVLIRKPKPESITKIQRRSFLRVPAELEIAAALSDQIRFLGMTDDVSGGGLSMLYEGEAVLSNESALSCWLLLSYKTGKVDHVPFKGEVVRVKTLDNGKRQIMMRFLEITDKDRQKVVRYCFERQLDIRKV